MFRISSFFKRSPRLFSRTAICAQMESHSNFYIATHFSEQYTYLATARSEFLVLITLLKLGKGFKKDVGCALTRVTLQSAVVQLSKPKVVIALKFSSQINKGVTGFLALTSKFLSSLFVCPFPFMWFMSPLEVGIN